MNSVTSPTSNPTTTTPTTLLNSGLFVCLFIYLVYLKQRLKPFTSATQINQPVDQTAEQEWIHEPIKEFDSESKENYFTLSCFLKSSLLPELAEDSDRIEDALKSYSAQWSDIRFIATEILRFFIVDKLNAGHSLIDLDDINNFGKFMKFMHVEYSAVFDYEALERATKEVGKFHTLPTNLPAINGFECQSMTNLIGREIERDLRNCLWMNMIQWQKKSIDLILEQNKTKYIIHGIDLNTKGGLSKASFGLRKLINGWEFGDSIPLSNFCFESRKLIDEFKKIFDFKCKEKYQQLSLSKYKLKNQEISLLLNLVHQMIQITKRNLKDQSNYKIEFIPSKSNRISMIPFNAAVFSSVFDKLIGRRQMRQVFDISSLKTNHRFDDHIRTNGTKICFQFQRRLSGESKIKVKQINQASIFISLSVIASISNNLSKSNS